MRTHAHGHLCAQAAELLALVCDLTSAAAAPYKVVVFFVTARMVLCNAHKIGHAHMLTFLQHACTHSLSHAHLVRAPTVQLPLLSIYLSLSLLVSLSVYLSVCFLSVCLPICLSASPPVCPPAYLHAYLHTRTACCRCSYTQRHGRRWACQFWRCTRASHSPCETKCAMAAPHLSESHHGAISGQPCASPTPDYSL